jgi:hypothetical protein
MTTESKDVFSTVLTKKQSPTFLKGVESISNLAVRFFTVSDSSMHDAIKKNDIEAAKRLIKIGIDINAIYASCPPLVTSFIYKKFEIFYYY